MSKRSRPIPLTGSDELLHRLDEAAVRMRRTRALMTRDANEIVLDDLLRCDYELASAVVDKARGGSSRPATLSMAAESSVPPEPAECPEKITYPGGRRHAVSDA